MRTCLEDSEEEMIESDNRFAKSNYGLRKNYSIEIPMLEK